MSQLAVVWRVVSPMLLAHPWLQALRQWSCSGLRLLSAFIAAGAAYGLVMAAVIELYPLELPHAALVYSLGLAVASWLGTCAGALAARRGQQVWVANAVAALAMAVPVTLAVHGGLNGQRELGYLWYMIGTGIGGLAAVRLLASLTEARTMVRQA